MQQGTKHEGSVQSLLEGKEDVELAGVALTKQQVLNCEEKTSITLINKPQFLRSYLTVQSFVKVTVESPSHSQHYC